MAENSNLPMTPAGFDSSLMMDTNDTTTQFQEQEQQDQLEQSSSVKRRSQSLGATTNSNDSVLQQQDNNSINNTPTLHHSRPALATNTDEYRKMALERNRAAASKCRQKKREWVQELQDKVNLATQRREPLQVSIMQLREELGELKGLLVVHSECGCKDIQTYMKQRALIS